MKTLVSLFLLSIVLTVSGCSTVPVEETEIVPGGHQNAATIIFRVEDTSIQAMTHNEMIEGDEDYIVSCIENSIKKQNPGQSFISYSQFVETILFPDFLEMQYSREPETYSRLLVDEKFYKDVLSYGVRYLIFVRGSTSETDGFGGFYCGGSDPGCMGFEIWDYKTQLTASILDLHQKETVIDDLESIFEDTKWAAGLMIYIVVPSFTESNACEDIGNRVGKILLERAKQ